jgi:hypothetical protein
VKAHHQPEKRTSSRRLRRTKTLMTGRILTRYSVSLIVPSGSVNSRRNDVWSTYSILSDEAGERCQEGRLSPRPSRQPPRRSSSVGYTSQLTTTSTLLIHATPRLLPCRRGVSSASILVGLSVSASVPDAKGEQLVGGLL